jgi:hypothetical protein
MLLAFADVKSFPFAGTSILIAVGVAPDGKQIAASS